MVHLGNLEAAMGTGAPLFDPATLSGLLAGAARAQVAELVADGSASPVFTRWVDGIEGASEDSVRPDGSILYEFQYLDEVVAFALDYCRARSPVDSGTYRDSWFALVAGNQVDPSSAHIPPLAEVLVTNDQPYHRKIEVGAMHMTVPPHIVEQCRQAVLARWASQVSAGVRYVQLPGGYVLRGRAQSPIYKVSIPRRGIAAGQRRPIRSGLRAGQAMTYPALALRLRSR